MKYRVISIIRRNSIDDSIATTDLMPRLVYPRPQKLSQFESYRRFTWEEIPVRVLRTKYKTLKKGEIAPFQINRRLHFTILFVIQSSLERLSM